MTRVIVANARTGRRLLDVPFLDISWTSPLNGLDDVTVTVTLNDPDVAKLNLRSAGAPGKAILAVLEFDVFMASGFVWTQEWDEDSNHLTLSAAGWGSYFNRRVVLPTNANNPDPIILTADLTEPVQGEEEPREIGDSNPATDTVISGFDLGTIFKKLCQLMLSHPGSPEFFEFEADRVGTRQETIKGAELKNGWDALSALTERDDGPDAIFETRWTTDRLGLEVLVRTGTEAQPRLFTPFNSRGVPVLRWDKTVPEPSVTGLKVKTSADGMASKSWVSGGRSANEAIIVAAINERLLDEGYPLLEVTDAHPTASVTATLQSYASGLVTVGQYPTEWWTFDVKKDVAPKADAHKIGDYLELKQGPGSYLAAGTYRRRIVARSGGVGSEISIVTEEVQGAWSSIHS